ncbi:PDZ domain-containing protein [Strongyloides ratti]|uniref:PDZ domain-containing protein n=1 Tax=Strongyloides ratti TaxID=34506 RepID=A0A090L049_STRRB|nr:PDZ domain-containing protein [Strongyloides ratti]CEF63145.1 PDZ domain-containing protein [Strongyloides ratti]
MDLEIIIFTVELTIQQLPFDDIELNQHLFVTGVAEYFINHLKIGDKLIQINDEYVSTIDIFEEIMEDLLCKQVTCHFERIVCKNNDLIPIYEIESKSLQFVDMKEGYIYFGFRLTITNENECMGFYLKHYQSKVLITKLTPNFKLSRCLSVGDHIIAVNELRVSNKHICHDKLIKMLRQYNCAILIIERPISNEAKKWTYKALNSRLDNPASVKMKADVRDIAMKIKNEMILCDSGYEKTVKSILIKNPPTEYPSGDDTPTVTFEKETTEFNIGTDVSASKKLKKVKKPTKARILENKKPKKKKRKFC